MQRKPSPGPWKINGPSSLRDDSVQILDAEDETVTHVIADDTQEIEDGSIAEVLSGKAKANARLIAAAPELYAALEAAEALLKLHGYPAFKNSDSIRAQARAALRKADGDGP